MTTRHDVASPLVGDSGLVDRLITMQENLSGYSMRFISGMVFRGCQRSIRGWQGNNTAASEPHTNHCYDSAHWAAAILTLGVGSLMPAAPVASGKPQATKSMSSRRIARVYLGP
jgi:hypothetical protein